MDDVAIGLEHVNLLNALDRLGVELLERCLKLLVVSGRAGGCALNLSAGGTLSTIVISVRYILLAMIGGGRAQVSLYADIPCEESQSVNTRSPELIYTL